MGEEAGVEAGSEAVGCAGGAAGVNYMCGIVFDIYRKGLGQRGRLGIRAYKTGSVQARSWAMMASMSRGASPTGLKVVVEEEDVMVTNCYFLAKIAKDKIHEISSPELDSRPNSSCMLSKKLCVRER